MSIDEDLQGKAKGRDEQELIRSRQRSRALVMALLLGAFVVLVFAISIVKMNH